MRISKILLRSYLVLLATAFLCQSLVELWIDSRCQTAGHQAIAWLRIAFIIAGLLCSMTIFKSGFVGRFVRLIKSRFARSGSIRLRHIALVSFFVTNLVLALLIKSIFGSLSWYGGRIAAIVADHAGYYEAGELIYSLLVRGDDSSLATFSSIRSHDSYGSIESHKLDTTVARIYGAQSRQMAFRYRILGIHRAQSHDAEAAESAYKSSLNIYRSLHDNEKCFELLGALAQIASERSQTQKSCELVNEALAILPECRKSARIDGALVTLWFVAKESYPQKAKIFFAEHCRLAATGQDFLVWAAERQAR